MFISKKMLDGLVSNDQKMKTAAQELGPHGNAFLIVNSQGVDLHRAADFTVTGFSSSVRSRMSQSHFVLSTTWSDSLSLPSFWCYRAIMHLMSELLPMKLIINALVHKRQKLHWMVSSGKCALCTRCDGTWHVLWNCTCCWAWEMSFSRYVVWNKVFRGHSRSVFSMFQKLLGPDVRCFGALSRLPQFPSLSTFS